MTGQLVPLADYLTYPEAVELYHDLATTGIIALVKSCGPPSLPFGEGMYFQLLVNPSNIDLAAPVLAAFSEKQAQNKGNPPTCPACHSEYVQPERKVPLWKKIVYAGTTLFFCPNCRQSFFV